MLEYSVASAPHINPSLISMAEFQPPPQSPAFPEVALVESSSGF